MYNIFIGLPTHRHDPVVYNTRIRYVTGVVPLLDRLKMLIFAQNACGEL